MYYLFLLISCLFVSETLDLYMYKRARSFLVRNHIAKQPGFLSQKEYI
jgi:hypothetical protein